MNLESHSYYIQKIQNDFLSKKRKNPSYSLRAYARFLEIDHSSLSSILRGKRKLPLMYLSTFFVKLRLSPIEKKIFEESVKNNPTSLKELSKKKVLDFEKVISDETHYRIIAEWEHYAILTLIQSETHESKISWFAKRLAIKNSIAKTVID